MVNITINNRHIAVPPGSTILQAARAAGIHIPVLCEFPGLEAVGACRICLVEVEKSPKPVAACTTPVVEGMVVHTHSSQILETRRTLLQLIISKHPLDCFSCSSNGACLLQDICYELDVTESPYSSPSEDVHSYPLDDSNPFILRDRNKCVLCGRCVRVCDGHARYHAVDFIGRGKDTMVDPSPCGELEQSDCVFCGQCVQVCPVGALVNKPSLGQGRAWETHDVKTVCAYCGVGCELMMQVNQKTGKIANMASDYASETSFNKGRTCVKGRFAWSFVHSDERLTTPLVREGDAFRSATWDEALSLVAKELMKAKSHSGADSVGFLASARCTNEENYLMQRLAREVIGTNNVDHCAHL